MNQMEYTDNYIKDVLKYELHIRGYRKVNIRKKKDVLEVNADGLKANVYNLDIINPFSDDIHCIVRSVVRQLALNEFDKKLRGGKM